MTTLNINIKQIKLDAVEEKILKLPEKQQLVVKNCIEFAGKDSRGRRYSKEWICLSLLMRSLSSRLYDRMREFQILPLPCKLTLNEYIKNLGLTYGFQDSILDCLGFRASQMNDYEKRGILVGDEMSISESIYFTPATFTLEGFVYLGASTPDEERLKRADHALVLMFQPFQGQWVQPIGMFLSKGAATSKILKPLFFEAIERLGKKGFMVDGVTTDGATWNRRVWTICGIDETANVIFCKNPFKPPLLDFYTKDCPLFFLRLPALNQVFAEFSYENRNILDSLRLRRQKFLEIAA